MIVMIVYLTLLVTIFSAKLVCTQDCVNLLENKKTRQNKVRWKNLNIPILFAMP